MMKHKTSFCLGMLLVVLVLTMLLVSVVQTSYEDTGAIVSASSENKIVSFTVSTSDKYPPIYGFIVTSINHGHYTKIFKSPDGWMPGNIQYHAAMWTTKTHPIQPGSTEDNFATEVTRKGTYEIRWSVLDNTLQPVDWGIITITVT